MTIQQMTYILALYEEKHFIKASERCFVTQPTLSIQLKKAEESLGNKIFDRNSNPVKATPFGEKIIPVIQDLLVQYDRIQKISNEYKGFKNEVLQIGIIPTIGSYLMPDLGKLIKNSNNETKFHFYELKTNQLINKLNDFKLDLIIIAGPYFDIKLKSIKLFEEELFIYCPTFNGTKMKISDLIDKQPWMMTEGNCIRNQMIEFCQIIQTKDRISPYYEGGNIDVLKGMVDQFGGYTVIPENLVKTNKYKSGLFRLFKDKFNPGREIIAVYSKRTLKEESIKNIISLIKNDFHSSNQTNLEIINWK